MQPTLRATLLCIDGDPQGHLVRYPAIFSEEEAVAENNLVGEDEGLTEN